ncbi:MAG: Uma2 family endonuclease [Chloroherpetonaceae bacterium]|nr:Uma2 family endonuclease [Chloroherpetonaceae bacterium]
MDTPIVETLSDYELERGKPMPNFNHGYIQANLIVALRARYGKRFSVVSEVSIPIGDKDATPDVLIFPKRAVDWFETKPALSEPPILAIEIQSPSQPMETIIDKAKAMLNHGVKSVWIIQPAIKTVSVFTKDAPPKTYVEGAIRDSVSDIELSFEEIFATE